MFTPSLLLPRTTRRTTPRPARSRLLRGAALLATAALCWPRNGPVPPLLVASDPPPAPLLFAARRASRAADRPAAWRYQALSLHEITAALVATGSSAVRAAAVAPAVREWAQRRDVSPLLVTSVLAVENPPLNATARSSAGARGLMQVMPLHWRPGHPCGPSLTATRTNLCLGTAILADGLSSALTLRGALLRYNGCVRTPGCERYASRVAAAYGRQHAAITRQRANPGAIHTLASR